MPATEMSAISGPQGEQRRVGFNHQLVDAQKGNSGGGSLPGALEEQNSLGTQEETRQVAFPKELMRSKQSTDASVETAGNNSLLEAEAAEHAVNYHRVRRRVQEDIRKSLLRNPVIRHKLQGPRVLSKETISYLSTPSEGRSPANGFTDENTLDWISLKAEEAAKRREGCAIRDTELRKYKEEQAKELEDFRRRQAEKQKQMQTELEIENMIAAARSEFANKSIATAKSSEILRYATKRQSMIENAKARKAGSFCSRIKVDHAPRGV